MAEVLSQSEIDELLSALSSGDYKPEEIVKEEENHKIKVYDFKSPQKFSKELLRTLELIYDNYSRIISNYLTAQVRQNVKVSVASIQQITYEEFIHSVSNPTILTIFKMPPLNGSILFESNPQFVYQILELLLGGSGESQIKHREFTDIDKNIIKQVNKGLISNMKLAWEDILEVNTEIESIETNPALNQTMAPNEPVALLTFSIEMGKNLSILNLCIPFLSVESLIDKMVVQYKFEEKNDENKINYRENINKSLKEAKVNITSLLGDTTISVNEFLTLGENDIITLDSRCDECVKIYVEDKLHFYGKPGVISKNKGVQIVDILSKDVVIDE